MAVILSNVPGLAVTIPDPTVVPVTFGVGGWGGAPVRNAIVRGVSVNAAGNYQLRYTLRNYTYVYIFGEKAGDFMMTGLTFAGACNNNFAGISGVLNYYGQYRIAQYGNTVPIQIGAAGFWGFLVGVSTGIQDADSRLGQFSLIFKTLPVKGAQE